jgi:multiple sugar transport system substrate-binding protein
MRKFMRFSLLFIIITSLTIFLLFACKKGDSNKTEIEVWFHSGKGMERDCLNSQIEEFNNMQSKIVVIAKQLPEGSYTEQVNAAALAGELPDLLDFDGPFVYNFAWAKYLQPIDKYIDTDLKNDILPSIIKQGTYKDKLWSLGTFDSGLGIYANKKYLEKAGLRIPNGIDDAWTREEFDDALKKLQNLKEVEYALDLKMNYGRGEWFTYAFSPILQSFGSDLIDRTDYQKSDGVLNNSDAIAAMKYFQSWFTNKYTKYNPGGDTDFADGKCALSYVGHWQYVPHKEALGDDLVLLAMPKFGGKSATGMGSWNWGLTSNSKNPEEAMEFLLFLMQPDQILKMTDANGAIPSRKSAIEQREVYKKDGDLAVFIEQLNSTAVPRPETAGYAVITSSFAEAIDNIAKGIDVKSELDKAVKKIDQDIEDNKGYK